LKYYVHFDNEENNRIFDRQLQQIIERSEAMGIDPNDVLNGFLKSFGIQ
jgi:hypothetical protein